MDTAFNILRDNGNTQEVTDFITAIRDFKFSLFEPLVDIDHITDQMPLLNRLRATRNSLRNCNQLMRPFIQNLERRIGARIDLARIDQNIFNGRGRLGTFIHPQFNLF